MSSGFVSGGTIDKPAERDDAWRQAQQELAENRRRKEEEAQQGGGKSLYEVLEANKAAKQEAFEEATRLKNQYRALDDDEAEFLDSVLESTRKQEEAVKRKTRERLEVFRKQQEEAERKALEEANAPGPAVVEDTQWVAGGRKRKKGSEKDGVLLKGVKLRKGSSTASVPAEATEVKKGEGEAQSKHIAAKSPPMTPSAVASNTQQSKNGKGAGAGPLEMKSDTTNVATASSPTAKSSSAVLPGLGYASSDEDD